MLTTIIRHQWRQLLRDRRAWWAGSVLVATSLAALVVGSVRAAKEGEQRERAAVENGVTWERQGVVNPHAAAHFGHFAFKPVSPLASLDPGLDRHLGTMVRLEAHRQHAASSLPDGGGFALASFPELSPAFALQVFGPVLLILATYGTFAGEGARRLLRQELGGGVPVARLVAGRYLGYATVVVGLLLLAGVAGGFVLAVVAAPADDFVRLGLWLVGAGLYLLSVLGLTLGVSALCRSARMALVLLLGCWAGGVLVLPRIAPAVGRALFPLPSAPELDLEAVEAVNERLDGGQPSASRAQRLREMALREYGVSRVEDLPVNLSGFLLEYSEEQSTAVFRAHFAEVFHRYSQQESVQRGLALLSPLPALRAWSAAMTGTDMSHHRRFLEAAESYRHAFVQALNRDILRHRPAGGAAGPPYAADVAAITAEIGRFSLPPAPLRTVLARAWPDLALLAGWAVAMGIFAARAAQRLVTRL